MTAGRKKYFTVDTALMTETLGLEAEAERNTWRRLLRRSESEPFLSPVQLGICIFGSLAMAAVLAAAAPNDVDISSDTNSIRQKESPIGKGPLIEGDWGKFSGWETMKTGMKSWTARGMFGKFYTVKTQKSEAQLCKCERHVPGTRLYFSFSG